MALAVTFCPHGLGVGGGHRPDQHGPRRRIDSLDDLEARLGRPARFGRLAKGLDLFLHCDDPVGYRLWSRLERPGRHTHHRVKLLHAGHRRGARQRRDPTHALGNRFLGHDLQQPDLAGSRQVRPAAKFDRRLANGDHANGIRILLAENRPHAGNLLGVGQREHVHRHRLVGEDSLVGQTFDPGQLLGRDGLVVMKVESQAVGAHLAAGLVHVIAQDRSQGPVQHVRARVVPPNRRPLGPYDAGNGLPGRQLAGRHGPHVEHRRAGQLRVGYGKAAAVERQLAGIAELAALFGVEVRLVQHDRRLVAGGQRAVGDELSVENPAQHGRFDRLGRVLR